MWCAAFLFSNIFCFSVSTAPTEVPEGAIGPFSQLQQSKSKKQVYYIFEYISNFYAFLGPIEPQSNIHSKKPAVEVTSVTPRYRQSKRNKNTRPLQVVEPQNVTSPRKTALTETRVIMSCHHVLYEMMTNEKTLVKTLSLYRLILEKIQKMSSFSDLNAYVYSIFTEPSDKSLFEFLCCLIYIGFSTLKDNISRENSHSNSANSVYEDKSKKFHGDKLYQRIAAYWHSNGKVFNKKICRDLTEQQGLFTEHAMILFAINMLQNCNGNQGSQFDSTIEKMGLDRESIIKIGCALMVDFYQINTNTTLFAQIPRKSFSVDPARANDYLQ